MIKMQNIIRRFQYNFIFAVLFTFAAILPDYVMQYSSVHSRVAFDPVFWRLSRCSVFSVAVGQNSFLRRNVVPVRLPDHQLNYMAYSGRPISPVDIHKIFVEFPDIWSSGMGAIKDVWFVTPMLFLTFGGTAYFFFKYRKQLGFSFLALLIVIGAVASKPERASRKTLKHFLPAETRNSIHNSWNTFSYYLVKGRLLPETPVVPEGTYLPVKAEKIKQKNAQNNRIYHGRKHVLRTYGVVRLFSRYDAASVKDEKRSEFRIRKGCVFRGIDTFGVADFL